MEPKQTITHFHAQISSHFVAVVGVKFVSCPITCLLKTIKKLMARMGFEPATPRFGGRSADHYARLDALPEWGEVTVSFSVSK